MDGQAEGTSAQSPIISPADVQTILSQSDLSARPAPAEHVVPAESRRSQEQQNARSNRFSMTFPIAPPSKEVSPTRSSMSLSRDDRSPDILSPSSDSSTFLTAIAAQERRVLEIKEELQRAEADLDRLKLQWATHEAQKKKSDARKSTQLRPLSTVLPPSSDREDGSMSSTLSQQEMERRRSLIAGPRSSNRTVFSGSRHTRTLSLLAPAQGVVQSRPRGATSPGKSKPEKPLPRASTTPDLSLTQDKSYPGDINIDKDVILETGKKVAIGIKDGLWTFWEDLRQATVGEDIVQAHSPQQIRKQSSVQTLRSPRRGGKSSQRGSSRSSQNSKASVDTSRASTRSPVQRRSSPKKQVPLADDSGLTLTTENLRSSRKTPTTAKKHMKSPSVALSAASSDAWDGWDESPKVSRSSSATSESTSRPSPVNTGGKEVDSRDPIPWPTLTKFGSTNTLRRTASNLMSEWDKPAEQKDLPAIPASES